MYFFLQDKLAGPQVTVQVQAKINLVSFHSNSKASYVTDASPTRIRMEGTGALQELMMTWTISLGKAFGATVGPEIVPNRGSLKVPKVPSLLLKLRMNVSEFKANDLLDWYEFIFLDCGLRYEDRPDAVPIKRVLGFDNSDGSIIQVSYSYMTQVNK